MPSRRLCSIGPFYHLTLRLPATFTAPVTRRPPSTLPSPSDAAAAQVVPPAAGAGATGRHAAPGAGRGPRQRVQLCGGLGRGSQWNGVHSSGRGCWRGSGGGVLGAADAAGGGSGASGASGRRSWGMRTKSLCGLGCLHIQAHTPLCPACRGPSALSPRPHAHGSLATYAGRRGHSSRRGRLRRPWLRQRQGCSRWPQGAGGGAGAGRCRDRPPQGRRRPRPAGPRRPAAAAAAGGVAGGGAGGGRRVAGGAAGWRVRSR